MIEERLIHLADKKADENFCKYSEREFRQLSKIWRYPWVCFLVAVVVEVAGGGRGGGGRRARRGGGGRRARRGGGGGGGRISRKGGGGAGEGEREEAENCHHHASFSLQHFCLFIPTTLSFVELKLLVGLQQNNRELKGERLKLRNQSFSWINKRSILSRIHWLKTHTCLFSIHYLPSSMLGLRDITKKSKTVATILGPIYCSGWWNKMKQGA